MQERKLESLSSACGNLHMSLAGRDRKQPNWKLSYLSCSSSRIRHCLTDPTIWSYPTRRRISSQIKAALGDVNGLEENDV
jgi:hypothetical protein